MVFINYGWYAQEGKEKEELWIQLYPCIAPDQGKRDVCARDILVFFLSFLLVHVVIKLAPKDIYCQKNSYGRS